MTHKESRKRNNQIRAEFSEGADIATLASKYQIALSTVALVVSGMRAEAKRKRDAKIATLYRDGVSLSKLSGMFNLRPSTIRVILAASGVRRTRDRHANEGRNADIVSAALAGETFTAIGNRFGITRERVRQIAEDHNIFGRERIARADAEIAARVRQGHTQERIARDFEITIPKVRAIARRYGLIVRKRDKGYQSRILQVIGELCQGREPHEVAKRYGIGVRGVYSRAGHARQCGIPVPDFRSKRDIA